MPKRRLASIVLVPLLAFSWPVSASAQEYWTVRGGTTTLTFDAAFLELSGLTIARSDGLRIAAPAVSVVLEIGAGSKLTFSIEHGSVGAFLGGKVVHIGGLALTTRQGRCRLEQLALGEVLGAAFESRWCLKGLEGAGGFIVGRHKWGFDPASHVLTIHSPDLRISPALAEGLGAPNLANRIVGELTTRAQCEWAGGDEPTPEPPASPGGTGPRAAIGPDMTFCQLYGLYQPSGARVGDVVGLSVGTTSWNVGDEDLMWFGAPDEEHPFIVMNLYRLKDDRFEQIGQSHIKHGFYALANTQCGGSCSHEPGHGPGDWLGVGCTDTYSPGLNASQGGFGPRHEVNPWTGDFTYAGSHYSSGHGHDGIQHRLQVHDDDLDPSLNLGAKYLSEGYYVCFDDVDVMNSAAWKIVTVSGGPGGTWTFGMSGAAVNPKIGFAIDAWSNAKTTVIAEQLPVVEFVSPDGRCVLRAKVTAMGGDLYHYEYALLNVDMDRKVGSFSVPVTTDTIVTNVGFHAVESHDEPYSNTPWSALIDEDSIAWSTADNPLRWGTLYNFRFDADAPPVVDATVTLGLFEPGSPTTLTGTTFGPTSAPPDCNLNSIDDPCDVDCGSPGGPCDVPGCGLSLDCQPNGIPDECETDCQPNGVPDDCDIANLISPDCNTNGIPDECETDCQPNGIPDDCDIVNQTSTDCNANGIPDECEPGYDCGNDSCLNATVICPGTYSGTTTGMVNDGSASCGNSGASPDVWFSYTPASSGTFTVETCGGGDFDTALSIHAGCPGTAGNELACSDDACDGTRSSVSLSATGGTTYIIRVSGDSGAAGDFTLTVSAPDCEGDPIRGGRMWDEWWVVNGAPVPNGSHPLYPPAGQQSGSTTFRCKECHGWDYKGVNGAYGSGPHHTGIPGVFGSVMTPSQMFDILKNDAVPGGHGFSNYGLSDQDIWDLIGFMQGLVIDTDSYIDGAGQFVGDPILGEQNYISGSPSCRACHGDDGTSINFGTPENPEWIGSQAVYDPWKLLHKTRFGDAGTGPMPSWLAEGGSDQGAADLGLYCQLNFPADCLNDGHCDDGDPCTGPDACQAGRCAPRTLDGDMDLDGHTDGWDIQAFVDAVVAGSTDPVLRAHGDFSGNAIIDVDDLPCLVVKLLAP